MSMPQHFGVYRGVVTSSADPEARQRVKAKVPQLLGGSETDWAWPCVPPGWRSGLLQTHGDPDGAHPHNLVQATPKPGEGVWIMFEGGDITKPIWIGTT